MKDLNVYQRLNNARNEFHSLQLKKTGHNKFAGYYYFELGDFLIPALKVFSQHGLFACVSFDTDKASMTIRNTDRPDEMVTIYSPMGSAALKGCHEVQNIGAVETYQRRYLWVAALEIVEHDALDATVGNKHTPINAATVDIKINPEDEEYLKDLAGSLVDDVEARNEIELAFDKLESAKLDSDQKLVLWNILQPNSRTRSALKKEGEARRAAHQAAVKAAAGDQSAAI